METIQLKRDNYWECDCGLVLKGMSIGEASEFYTTIIDDERVPTWINRRVGDKEDYWGYIDEEGIEYRVEFI